MTQEHDAETVERVARAINGPRDATHIGEEKLRELQEYRWHNQTDKAERQLRRIEARAALSAMPAREVTGWQPISTAPHGVEVMVVKAGAHPFTGKPYIPITAYYEPHIWTDHMDRICDDYDPTHWMPLPPSPEGV